MTPFFTCVCGTYSCPGDCSPDPCKRHKWQGDDCDVCGITHAEVRSDQRERASERKGSHERYEGKVTNEGK